MGKRDDDRAKVEFDPFRRGGAMNGSLWIMLVWLAIALIAGIAYLTWRLL